ncbi:hypothetical protein ACHAWF_007108 [Thalassiosira exigua]
MGSSAAATSLLLLFLALLAAPSESLAFRPSPSPPSGRGATVPSTTADAFPLAPPPGVEGATAPSSPLRSRRSAVSALLAPLLLLPSPALAESDGGSGESMFAPKFVQAYEDFVATDEGWSYKDVKVGKGGTPSEGDRVVFDWSGYTIGYFGRPFEAKGGRAALCCLAQDTLVRVVQSIMVCVFAGGTADADYFDETMSEANCFASRRPFALAPLILLPSPARRGPQGGAFDKDLDYSRAVLGSGKLIPGLDAAFRTMTPGGIRQVIIPYGPLSYPADDLDHVKVGPKPANFSGMRALNFVLENPRVDRTLLFNVKLVRVDKNDGKGGFVRG